MHSILQEISKIRSAVPLVPDPENSNRYRVVALESNGTKTAYYFSAPIYNRQTRRVVDLKFHTNGNTASCIGSHATITASNSIRLENDEGSCTLSLSVQISHFSEHEIGNQTKRIYPTTNGIAIQGSCKEGAPFCCTVEISNPFLEVRANHQYFALMSERFLPFATISCIGTLDEHGTILAPARISHQKNSERSYTITVYPCSPLGKSVFFEVNLYEPKLFQDTTVESNHTKTNNAFGGIGFIGITKEFGEQWLYTRLDDTKFSELQGKKLLHAILHLPRWNHPAVELTASKVTARFCSFGSTWENKIPEAPWHTTSQSTENQIVLDITPLLTDRQGRFSKNEGFILKPKQKYAGFSVISTGDSYYAPQILEIHYR